jgi:ABC-type sugar transport system ATPase subunit
MSAAIIELCQVGKSFGATRALDAVSFDLVPGEVHVLAGENGAGKSTLIRILSGAITDYEGELRIDGQTVRFAGPADAVRAKIATIHQELTLIGAMSVADNLALGWRHPAWSLRARAGDRARAQQLLAELGLAVDPDQRVERLPLSIRQELEIGRALAQGARVIVMDEPTSALGEQEVERLFARIRALSERGTAIVYISHRMDEIFSLADRISVLRDGRRVLTAPAGELDPGALIEAMWAHPGETHPRARP